jgi:hypothetical protein
MDSDAGRTAHAARMPHADRLEPTGQGAELAHLLEFWAFGLWSITHDQILKLT